MLAECLPSETVLVCCLGQFTDLFNINLQFQHPSIVPGSIVTYNFTSVFMLDVLNQIRARVGTAFDAP